MRGSGKVGRASSWPLAENPDCARHQRGRPEAPWLTLPACRIFLGYRRRRQRHPAGRQADWVVHRCR